MRVRYWYLLAIPALLFALGYSMNAAVMAANHGQMPVTYPGGGCGPDEVWQGDLLHVCETSATRLKFLSDWVVMAEGGKIAGIASPGDFAEWAGQAAMWPCIFIWFGLICSKEKYDRAVNANARLS